MPPGRVLRPATTLAGGDPGSATEVEDRIDAKPAAVISSTT
jgi:hypothetical protein